MKERTNNLALLGGRCTRLYIEATTSMKVTGEGREKSHSHMVSDHAASQQREPSGVKAASSVDEARGRIRTDGRWF